MKHTPGPWHIAGGSVVSAENGFVARVNSSNYPNFNVANANLIAAAPDLLEALKEIWPRYQEMFVAAGLGTSASESVLFAQVEAAIAKAEGK